MCVCITLYKFYVRVPEILNEYIISIGSNKEYELRPPQRINLIISSLVWVFAHLGRRDSDFVVFVYICVTHQQHREKGEEEVEEKEEKMASEAPTLCLKQ